MNDLYEVFAKLGKSKFRQSIKLTHKDRAYLLEKGIPTMAVHARDLIAQRLAPAKPKKDGKQTPYQGHPVFAAQHGSATCCRSCLSKWHGIPKGIELDEAQQGRAVDAILLWLALQEPSLKL